MRNLVTYLAVGLLAFNTVLAQPSPRDAYQTFQAEAYDGQRGIKLSNGGRAVGFIQDGDYIYFDNLDFSDGDPYLISATLRVASNTSGGQIEWRLGSPTGELAGVADVSNTGGWTSFENVTISNINTPTIVNEPQTVYFIFRGGAGYLLDVDEFSFSTDEVMATGLQINNCPTQVELGTTYQFDVTVIPSNTTNQTVAFYASGGTGVDYLSGEYTATSLGTQTVSVTSFSNGAASDRCTFEVVERITDESTPSLVRAAATAPEKDKFIGSSDEAAGIQLYPNPTEGTVTLVLPEAAPAHRVSIVDLSGKVVYQAPTPGGRHLPIVTGLPRGSYLVKVTASKRAYVERLVVE